MLDPEPQDNPLELMEQDSRGTCPDGVWLDIEPQTGGAGTSPYIAAASIFAATAQPLFWVCLLLYLFPGLFFDHTGQALLDNFRLEDYIAGGSGAIIG